MIEVRNLTKRFGDLVAIRDISFTAGKGEVLGFLGPNGAGKTTTIRMILDILLPDAGRVERFGSRASARHWAGRIGYLPEERGLYRRMRVLDVLVFLAEMKGVDRRAARERGRRWLERLGLAAWERRSVDDLSKGMQQKVQFISTVLHEPTLVILDEPFAGLDPVNAQALKDIVLELRSAGTTVLLSTHVMEQAEKLCDQVCIIAHGKKLVDGSLAEIKRTRGGRHVTLGFDGRAAGDAPAVLADRRLVRGLDDYGQYAEVELAPDADPQELLRGLVEAGVRLSRFELTEPSLHRIFMDLVSDGGTRHA